MVGHEAPIRKIRKMNLEMIKLAGALIASVVMLSSCGGAGSALTGPSTTERGESGAINPARHVTLICERNNNNIAVTTNITNNCNKNNGVAEPTVVEAPAPTVVEQPAPLVVRP